MMDDAGTRNFLKEMAESRAALYRADYRITSNPAFNRDTTCIGDPASIRTLASSPRRSLMSFCPDAVC